MLARILFPVTETAAAEYQGWGQTPLPEMKEKDRKKQTYISPATEKKG